MDRAQDRKSGQKPQHGNLCAKVPRQDSGTSREDGAMGYFHAAIVQCLRGFRYRERMAGPVNDGKRYRAVSMPLEGIGLDAPLIVKCLAS